MQQSQQSIESSNSDHNISDLKREISLSSALLIEIISHNDKFSDKLKVLNQSGVDAIYNEDYQVAIAYLQEAQKILEYAASCGKTIDRVLIISTLQNQACAYQRMWDLEKASNYLQAIIYNMNAYLQCAPEIKIDSDICDPLSNSYAVVSNFIRKKINTAFYYLQFSAVSSQIKKHDTALGSAFKALSVLKMVCEECFNYEKYVRRDEKSLEGPKMILRDLSCIKETVQLDKVQKYISLAQRGLHKLKSKHHSKSNQDKILQELANFAIGQVMQISPISLFALQNQQPKMREQVNYIQKIYKAIYISICFFAIATQLRLIAFQNYIEEKRETSIEFRKSQLYHLNSIILASKYVPCETRYLEHIVKSFTNHYKIDLLEYSSYSEHSDPETEHFPHNKILLTNLTNQQSQAQTNYLKSSKMETTKVNTFNSQKSLEKIKLPNHTNDMGQKVTARSKKSPKAQMFVKEEQLKHQNQTQNQKKSFQKIKNSSSKKYSNAHCSVNEFNLKKSVLTPNGQKYQRPERVAIGSGMKSNCKIILSPTNRCRKSKEASKDYGKINSKEKSKSKSRKKSKVSEEKSHREKSGAKEEQKKRKTNKLHQEYFVQENIHKKKKSKINHNTSNPKPMKKNNLHGAVHVEKLKNGEYLSMSKELFKKNEETSTYGGVQHGVRTSSKISHTKIRSEY